MFSNKEAWQEGYAVGYAAAREQNESKEYKLLDGRTMIFLHNDEGIGIIPIELMDKLMGEISKLTAERDESHRAWKAEAESVTLLLKAISECRAERDALLADVSDYQGNICAFCKNFKRIAHRSFCEHFDNLPMEDGVPLMCGKWEWRGVNHDTE